jgi:hypothetical protein
VLEHCKVQLKSEGLTDTDKHLSLEWSQFAIHWYQLLPPSKGMKASQMLKLADFKTFYLLIFFLKDSCEIEMLSSPAEGKETCFFLEVLNECKRK